MKLLSSYLIVVFIALLFHSSVFAVEYDFVVSADGSGDFQTVQDAIDAVPDFRKKETVIFIKTGVYKEKIVLPASKNRVTFMGEDVEKTIITNDDYASKKNVFGEEMGTTGSSGFFIFGDEFTALNITFENSAGPVGQAVAVRVDGDRVFFNNCRFLGFQDTLYPHGKNSRQYYKNCYIEGTVDFIFGWSTAVFDGCEIFCKRHGYITAASTDKDTPFGFVFLNCRIHGDADKKSVYLGRPWRPYAKTVFIGCEMSDVVNPGGWHNWGEESNEKTAFYAEFNSSGAGAAPNERVGWSYQLTQTQRNEYTLMNIFNGWVPGE
jgi:pectinesterase